MAEQVVTSLAGKAKDLLFGKAIEEISYVWNCSINVEELKDENKKLTEMKGRVQQKITAAKDKGETLLEGVEECVEKAERHISEAKKVIDGFEANADKMARRLKSLYHYGKKAAKTVTSVLKVQKDVGTFESCVSVPARTLRELDFYNRHNIDGLDTHKLCFEKIIESINDDNVQIIGIYGIGGVGKTTLAKEVAVTVKSLNLFADVKFITVSQTVDAKRIKEEAAVAANRIMNNGEKILVILDDLWGELNLGEVGIPYGANYKNCKILLTSRSHDVCKSMNATGLINVCSLKKEEAWILFKRAVGDTVETDENLKKIAEKVVEGCGGLPLIIRAVGAALKHESIESWKRTLTQLQEHTTVRNSKAF